MIHLTLVKGNVDLALRAELIITLNRNTENKMTTFITTTIIGPQGPLSYEVKESFNYVLEQYEAILENRPPAPLSSGLLSS
jgi:hypothetical protein